MESIDFFFFCVFQNNLDTIRGTKTSEEMETICSFQYQSREIFKNLNNLRKTGQLCDTVLKTSDGETFTVHRNILAAASDYFNAMFCGGFKEAQSDDKTPIVLQEISASGLNTVLNCIYSDTLILTKTTVFEVLAVAHMWCLENIVTSCGEYMVKHISTETCFATLRLSRKFALPDVEKGAEDFIRRNFVKLSKTEEFIHISCDMLCRFLQDDTLVGQELDFFWAAMRWLESGVGRFELSNEVMRLINFKSIACDQLIDEVINADIFTTNRKCFDMVLNAMKYHTIVHSQPLNGPDRIRGSVKVVVIEEGECSEKGFTPFTRGKMCIYNKTDILNVGDNSTVLPCKIQHLKVKLIEKSMNLVCVGSFLFLFGTRADGYDPVLKRFDGNMKIWIDLTPIPRKAAVATTAGLVGNEHILSVGGMLVTMHSKQIRDGSKFDSSVFRYSICRDEWENVQCFPSRVAYAASCSRHGTLYVAGGAVPKVNRPSSASVEVRTWNRLYAFDNKAQLWLSKAPMNNARSETVLEAVNDHLFVLGGCRDEDDEPVPSVEAYDIQANQWSFVEKQPGFRYDCAASFVDGESIFLLGGYNYKEDLACDHISVFSTREIRSRNITLLKQKLKNITCQHVCAILKMPN